MVYPYQVLLWKFCRVVSKHSFDHGNWSSVGQPTEHSQKFTVETKKKLSTYTFIAFGDINLPIFG